MTDSTKETMRDRTRRLTQSELAIVAQDLFLKNGYEATTVDHIAAAAGMSRRTFFRYFASKEDLVIGKYTLFGDRMAEALRERPANEPLWEALRRVLDITAVYFEDGPDRDRNEAMQRIVRSTPALHAAYLERTARTQDVVALAAAERMTDGPGQSLRASAIVGSAFACVSAAERLWQEPTNNKPFGELLDEAMAAVAPTPPRN